jgi:hypothetical protein
LDAILAKFDLVTGVVNNAGVIGLTRNLAIDK